MVRMTQKKIENVITQVVGEEGLRLVKELTGRENVSEFDLAKKMNRDIKVVRKMLYLLYNHNLVGFTRKKDKQKGWYIYYWTLVQDNIRFNYYKRLREQLARLREQLQQERQELFFVCPQNCARLNFDQATDFEFHCPECGSGITQDDNQKNIAFLQKQIAEIEAELDTLKEKRKVQRKQIKVKKKVAKKRAVSKKVVKKKRK